MDMNEVIDAICMAMQKEADAADYFRKQGNLLCAWFSEGQADGLRKALQYIEMYKEIKKAATPASAAADPLRKGDSHR